ncbi:hypothetical protein D3C71_1295580 [compost metagenome]
MLGLFSTFSTFNLLPANQHFFAVSRSGVAKNMRMATLQFVANGSANIIEIKAPLFLRHLRIKDHLEQQIAQFTAQIVKIFARDGVQYFVGLFEGVRCDGGEGLLFVPRTAVFRVTQTFHDAKQAVELSHVYIQN